jgi:2-C-methyl-D-erythritol 4-phosphate cytidylyltransferase
MLSAIIVAAGSSKRVGFDKLFSKIGDRSVLEHALAAFEAAESVSEIIVVCRDLKLIQDVINRADFRKVRAVVRGGERRQDSVQSGLNAVDQASEFVAVHDAARPLITPNEIERVFLVARKHAAAVLAAPITDTIKFADANQVVSGSIDRQNVFAMQTPQIFRRESLLDAYEHVSRNSLTVTDEVSAIEHAGGSIVIVPAQDHNLKITYASDLPLAEFILEQRSSSSRAESEDPAAKS